MADVSNQAQNPVADQAQVDLYHLQDQVIAVLQGLNDGQFVHSKLCGGTALSRCYLNHRMSYDLDFFFAEGFSASQMAIALKRGGIDYETKSLVDGPYKANQLHGYILLNGERLKVSFVEDAYFGLFPVTVTAMGESGAGDAGQCVKVRTEPIEGLYHRKLRTVAGHGSEGDSFAGGRQTARDVFDLYVLSQTVMPIRPFMQTLPYAFPTAAFDNGLASMPWFDLMDELGEIMCAPAWQQAKNVEFLQNSLYAQIGASLLVDDLEDKSEDSP